MYDMMNFNQNTPQAILDRRLSMIEDRENGARVKDLLVKYNLSKPVFHKFYNRFKEYGKVGLHDLSKAPKNHGKKVKKCVEEKIESLFESHPYFNPYELSDLTGINRMTIYRIMKRKGLKKSLNLNLKKKILKKLKERFQKRLLNTSQKER